MADVERNLTLLAERGSPLGSEELIGRLEAEMAKDPLVVVNKQRKGWGMSVQTDEKRENKQGSAVRGLALAAAAFIAIVGLAALYFALDDDPESDVVQQPGPPSTTVADPTVAIAFLEAKGTYDIDAALALVADDAVVGVGPASSKNELAFEISFNEATGLVAQPIECTDADGALICTVEYTTAISRARGLDADIFTYNVEVTGGQITMVRLSGLGSYSATNWEPFQTWIINNHGDDFGVMYDGYSDVAVSDEALALWEARTEEYARQVGLAPEAVADAFRALSAGDLDAYTDSLGGEEREGAIAWRTLLEADVVAHRKITFPNGCTYDGVTVDGLHIVKCYSVTTSDFYEAAGIVEEGDDFFRLDSDLKIVGWDSGNETNDPGDFPVELLSWLENEHPEVAAGMTAGSRSHWERTSEDVAVMLDYLDEFLAQSEVYPIQP